MGNAYKQNRIKEMLSQREMAKRMNISIPKYKKLEGEKMKTIKEVNDWFKNTDLKQLRLDKGYATQIEVGKLLGVHPSVITRLENKTKYSPKNVIDIYNFYNDEDVPTDALSKKKIKRNVKTPKVKKIEKANKGTEKRVEEYNKNINRDIELAFELAMKTVELDNANNEISRLNARLLQLLDKFLDE